MARDREKKNPSPQPSPRLSEGFFCFLSSTKGDVFLSCFLLPTGEKVQMRGMEQKVLPENPIQGLDRKILYDIICIQNEGQIEEDR